MPRYYTIPIVGLTGLEANTNPFFQLATPATMGIEVVSFRLGQRDSETSVQVALQPARRTTASTLPTASNIRRLNPNDAASLLASSTTTNAQGLATAVGTLDHVLGGWPFNILGEGLVWRPLRDEERIILDLSEFVTWSFLAVPPAGLTFDGECVVKELI